MVSNRNSGLFSPFSTTRTLRPLYWKLNVSHINLFLTLSEFLEREYSSALVALIVPIWRIGSPRRSCQRVPSALSMISTRIGISQRGEKDLSKVSPQLFQLPLWLLGTTLVLIMASGERLLEPGVRLKLSNQRTVPSNP